jgi:parallel beta-helix repeat protein
MRSLAAAMLVAVALLSLPGRAGALADLRRERLATQLDVAATVAQTVPAGRLEARRVGGMAAVVVARDATLGDLARVAPAAVRRTGSRTWEVERPVFVVRGATLSVTAPAAHEVRLLSAPGRFASVVAVRGSLRLRGARGGRLLVRSWDPASQGADTALEDGRASVSVRGSGRLDAADAAFEDLGFYEGRVSGVAVAAPRGQRPSTGVIRRSRFARNYFGAYTYNARDMRWVGDTFVDNAVYGFDPHDHSNGFVLADSVATGNGRHGIIFSRFCDRNVISGNVAARNGWHGIVLDDGDLGDGPSQSNLVARNRVADNGKVGISIDGSHGNVVRDNRISGGRYGVRLFGPARDNRVARNTIARAQVLGILAEDPASGTGVLGNTIVAAQTGIADLGAPGTTIAANRISGASMHAVKVEGDARHRIAGTTIGNNVLSGSGASPLSVAVAPDDAMRSGTNREDWSYPPAHDISRLVFWLGPAAWILIAVLVLAGPGVVAGVDRFARWRRS